MISERSWSDAQILWDFNQMHHKPQPCSVVIGLGSHDLGVADVAVALYRRGLAPLIVFTGATSPTTKERMPDGEALHYRQRALGLGVPRAAVLVEPQARNTGENIRFSQALLREAGVDVTSVLLVSKPYEERRAYATTRKLWPAITPICSSTSMSFRGYVTSIGDARIVIEMMVGATQRVLLYPKLGFTIPQSTPGEVVAAFERLCLEGFTSRLVAAGSKP
ncbi:YdcF family protein [Streptomyces sp. NPDC094458]|uniref:YdcF family protein n=1 Tax=Streptomyces sp. NPDC094458 TaxID=3155208 RepID=UPI00332188BB